MEDIIRVLPADWNLGRAGLPGDLRRFAPGGFAASGPLLMRPWDRLENFGQVQDYYGAEAPHGDPISAAPRTLAAGGVVYFDDGRSPEDLSTMFRMMGAWLADKAYAAFVARSSDTLADRYLEQMRIVGHGALPHLFGAPREEVAALGEQPLTIGEALVAFVRRREAIWNDGSAFSGKLAGSLGGDGDWAKEALAFGFAVENGHWCVYRIWSRPWLVTK
jgi:hypothetical protein